MEINELSAVAGRAGASSDSDSKPVSICSSCRDEVDEIVGCPDGAEVCQACFDAGEH